MDMLQKYIYEKLLKHRDHCESVKRCDKCKFFKDSIGKGDYCATKVLEKLTTYELEDLSSVMVVVLNELGISQNESHSNFDLGYMIGHKNGCKQERALIKSRFNKLIKELEETR